MRIEIASKRVLLGMVVMTVAAGHGDRAWGALIFTTSRSAFTAQNPGLPTETFESARVAAGRFAIISGPVNSTTNNGVFLPGDLLPGFSIASVGTNTDLVVTGIGTTPGATKTVGVATFSNSMDITFSPAVTAVGTDLLTSVGPGIVGSGIFDISIFGTSGLLGTTTAAVSGVNTFFGVVST